MDPTAGREAYRVARDTLVDHREDYDRAVANFRWPAVGDHFNWALDWFEPLAVGNQRTALCIFEEDGSDRSSTFAEISSSSTRLARSLAEHRVAAGDRMMVMLGNQVELWESMLALAKLGAVILPTTTALGPDDLADRIVRGEIRHVITTADQTARFADLAGDFGRIAIGDAGAPAALPARRRRRSATSAHHGQPSLRADADLLHLGHDQPAQACRAHPSVLPGRAPDDDAA